MPLDKHNSITANTTTLIFSLFYVASAQDVPFGILQYAQFILHGLTSVLLCVPFILLAAKNVNLVVARDGSFTNSLLPYWPQSGMRSITRLWVGYAAAYLFIKICHCLCSWCTLFNWACLQGSTFPRCCFCGVPLKH